MEKILTNKSIKVLIARLTAKNVLNVGSRVDLRIHLNYLYKKRSNENCYIYLE